MLKLAGIWHDLFKQKHSVLPLYLLNYSLSGFKVKSWRNCTCHLAEDERELVVLLIYNVD